MSVGEDWEVGTFRARFYLLDVPYRRYIRDVRERYSRRDAGKLEFTSRCRWRRVKFLFSISGDFCKTRHMRPGCLAKLHHVPDCTRSAIFFVSVVHVGSFRACNGTGSNSLLVLRCNNARIYSNTLRMNEQARTRDTASIHWKEERYSYERFRWTDNRIV